jgi:hypothetical protein
MEARHMLRLGKRSVGTALIVLLALVVVAACSATGGKRAADAAAELEEDAEELGTASHEPSTGNPPT